jgi:hypothetical protein
MVALVLRLFGDRLASISDSDKRDVCRNMGIQANLLDDERYRQALFKTSWDKFNHDYRKYIESIQALSEAVE